MKINTITATLTLLVMITLRCHAKLKLQDMPRKDAHFYLIDLKIGHDRDASPLEGRLLDSVQQNNVQNIALLGAFLCMCMYTT